MKEEQLLRRQNYHLVFKEKKTGGEGGAGGMTHEGSPLSSFNEKIENCFHSELPGLIEAQGSGWDAGRWVSVPRARRERRAQQ